MTKEDSKFAPSQIPILVAPNNLHYLSERLPKSMYDDNNQNVNWNPYDEIKTVFP